MAEERQKFCHLLPLAKQLYFMQCKQQVEFFETLWILFALYFCSGTQDVLVSWKRRSLEEWKFEVPFVYNLLSLKHFNTCSFSGHNPIYYSRRNSFISCVESVMFEKMSQLGTPIINHQLFNLFTQSRVEQIQGQFSHDEIEHLHQQVLKRKKKRVRCNDKN